MQKAIADVTHAIVLSSQQYCVNVQGLQKLPESYTFVRT